MKLRTAIACALAFAAVLGGAGPLCAVACAAEPAHADAAPAHASQPAAPAAPCHGDDPQRPAAPRGGPCDAGCAHALAWAPEAELALVHAAASPAAQAGPEHPAPAPARALPVRIAVGDASPPDLVLLHSNLRL